MMLKKFWYTVIICGFVFFTGCNLEDITTPDDGEGLSVSFTVSASSGETPFEVTFDASESISVNATITSYSWNFGDGTNGTGVTVKHTYLETGNFVVSLTVNDSAGQNKVSTKNIIVTAGEALYVDANFTGESTGSESSPFKMITAAMNVATSGQVIHVMNGEYNESFKLIGGIVLQGESMDGVILTAAETNAITVDGIEEASEINNFTIKGASGAGIYCGLSADITIKNCTFTENNHGIKIYNNANPVITNCTFKGNERGITIENNSSPEISSSNISENVDGIVVDNNASPQIVENVITANTSTGIRVENYSTPAIDGNTISENAERGLYISLYSKPYIANNAFSSNEVTDIKCSDSYSDFNDEGGNTYSKCNGCDSCGDELILDVAGRFEGSGTTDENRTVVRAMEIEQNGVNLKIKFFNQRDGVIPSEHNDYVETTLKAGESTLSFTTQTLGDQWDITFLDEGAKINATQIVAAGGKTVTITMTRQ
jgi:parallel beta-helix repeat protein